MSTTAITARPRRHFTPAENWMNDPNGLVFHKGLYHLFFQYNPEGRDHANMSWGHATSPDLVHWTEHEVAILHDESGAIFSGSVVFDAENTSGLGQANRPPLVAVYTLADAGRQTQAIAFSLDDGYTWTKYEGNPVLDRGSADFRDPKVFRYRQGEESYWVMLAVEAEQRQVLFYRSDDLIEWRYLSHYGPAGAVGGVWECPDMFPLSLDGDSDARRWVLLVSLNPGSLAGGSGTQYVVGHFDGTSFHPDDPLPEAERHVGGGFPAQDRDELARLQWLDYGRDCYAGVTFSGLPDRERTLIAWMNNWDYAHSLPTYPWRGAMTSARRLELVTVRGRPTLRQTPVIGTDLRAVPLAEPARLPMQTDISSVAVLDLRARLDAGARLAVRLGNAETAAVDVVLDEATTTISCKRYAAPGSDVPAGFEGVQHMDAYPKDGVWTLRICLDAGSVELFTSGGIGALTVLAGIDETAGRLTLETPTGGVTVQELRVLVPA
ncbi:GH32 C-terminal domain-containing protein [Streptomyces xiamenensis]